MEQFLDAIMLRLNQSQKLSIMDMQLVKHAVMEVLRDYEVTPLKNQIVTSDIFCPKGYKEFFVDKIMQGLSDQSIKQYKFQVDGFLHAVCKDISVITAEDISLYIYNKRVADNSSTTYQNHIRCCLSSFFGWLYDHEYIAKNPMKNIKTIKEKQVVKTGLTEEEFEKLMNAADTQRDRAILAVLAGSGVRRSELCGMTMDTLDMRNKRFKVLGKGNKERICFLTSRAKFELQKYLDMRQDDCKFVFVTERRPYRQIEPCSLTRLITKIGERSGVDSYTHKLRHFFADSAHDAGLDVLDIARMMGHASINTTNIYISRNVDDLAQKHARIR